MDDNNKYTIKNKTQFYSNTNIKTITITYTHTHG